MDKLFKMLERGEMPSFLEVLQALNDVSDIDWDRIEALQLSIRDNFEACRLPNTPIYNDRSACAACG